MYTTAYSKSLTLILPKKVFVLCVTNSSTTGISRLLALRTCFTLPTYPLRLTLFIKFFRLPSAISRVDGVKCSMVMFGRDYSRIPALSASKIFPKIFAIFDWRWPPARAPLTALALTAYFRKTESYRCLQSVVALYDLNETRFSYLILPEDVLK